MTVSACKVWRFSVSSWISAIKSCRLLPHDPLQLNGQVWGRRQVQGAGSDLSTSPFLLLTAPQSYHKASHSFRQESNHCGILALSSLLPFSHIVKVMQEWCDEGCLWPPGLQLAVHLPQAYKHSMHKSLSLLHMHSVHCRASNLYSCNLNLRLSILGSNKLMLSK